MTTRLSHLNPCVGSPKKQRGRQRFVWGWLILGNGCPELGRVKQEGKSTWGLILQLATAGGTWAPPGGTLRPMCNSPQVCLPTQRQKGAGVLWGMNTPAPPSVPICQNDHSRKPQSCKRGVGNAEVRCFQGRLADSRLAQNSGGKKLAERRQGGAQEVLETTRDNFKTNNYILVLIARKSSNFLFYLKHFILV